MEHEHEDLLRDGRSMPLRAAASIKDIRVVVGFRTDDQVSIYCGVDPVFQFNRNREIRRVYFESNRYAAEAGRLVRLKRAEGGARLQFETLQVNQMTVDAVIASLHRWLDEIRLCETWEVQGGQRGPFVEQFAGWIERLPDPLRIAESANA